MSIVHFFAIGCLFLGAAAVINMIAHFFTNLQWGNTEEKQRSLKEGRERILWLYFWISLPLLYNVSMQALSVGH